MSVIVQNQSNPEEIFLFMKGADNIILNNLDNNNNINRLVIPNLKESLDKYAKEGLRILAVAYKKLTLEELIKYQKDFIKASKNTYKKKEKLNELAKIIEKNLIFLGVTAIEDELQDEVNETLKDFSEAGIKLWVLTGDKKDTAKSIAYSCGLFDDLNFNIFEINEGLNKIQLEKRLNELAELFNNIVDKMNKGNKRKDKQIKIIKKNNNQEIEVKENMNNAIINVNNEEQKKEENLIDKDNNNKIDNKNKIGDNKNKKNKKKEIDEIIIDE
jgi:magnesium-transporting ATPase (P-type)